MQEWHKQIQSIIEEIDRCIKDHNDEALTLNSLACKSGYSEFHISRKFKEISGMQFRDFLRYRRLAFALKEVRDTEESFLEIALNYVFSHEAFTRAFKEVYGITPREYRQHPGPLVPRAIIKPFNCFLSGRTDMEKTTEDVKIYFVTVPAHKFLHIRNYESVEYGIFGRNKALFRIRIARQSAVCLTTSGASWMMRAERKPTAGQIMAYVNEPAGRICRWGIPLAECYGVRLPCDYDGEVPQQMLMMDVPEGEYVVFEHGPFDYESQNRSVEEKIEKAMAAFDYGEKGYQLDTSTGRVMYFFHDPGRYWKYIRPVRKLEK